MGNRLPVFPVKKSKKLKIDTIFDALSRGAIGFARSRSVGELQAFEKLVVVEKPIFFKLHLDCFSKNSRTHTI